MPFWGYGRIAFLVAMVGAVLAAGFNAAPAQAEPTAEWFEDALPAEQEGIVDYLYELSPQGSTPYTGESAVKEAEAITKAAAGEESASPLMEDLAGGVNGIEEGSGLIPSLSKAVPEVGAAGTAFAVGWKIGEGINADFLHIGLSEGSAPDVEAYEQFCYSQECGGGLTWAPYGEHLYNEATVQQEPGVYLYEGYLNGSGHWNTIRWFEPPCLFSLKNAPPGARMETGLDAKTSCWIGYLAPVYVDYPYVLLSDLIERSLLRRYNPLVDGSPGVVTETPEDPGAAAVEASAAEIIDSNEFLQRWLNYVEEPENYPDPFVTQKKIDDEKRRCDRGAPVFKNPGGNSSPEPFAKKEEAAFSVTNPPEGFATVSVYMRWGETGWRPSRETFEGTPYLDDWTGWGYRHIVAKHGWDSLDREETQLALLREQIPIKTEGGWRYSIIVGKGSEGVECERRVIVDFDQKENPAPRGIVTSFNAVK